MASLLRQIVAGPRAKHQETGLDLCYVTSNIIATSGPSQTYPQRAYRNPLDRLVAFLDAKHGDGWAIWEFRAEGTGYPDEAVYNRIRHYPWPDHHPPPFKLVPMIMASMRNWLRGGDIEGGSITGKRLEEKDRKDRVVVVHCKAGKGRSGTMACSYLISECGWTPEDALARFTERRMRPKFGAGVSIPSQLRWVSYVDRWTKGGKKYVDREIEIVEVHVRGLRHGVKVSVEGFVEEGKKIKVFHTFKREERIVVEGDAPGGAGVVDFVSDLAGYGVDAKTDETGEILEDADYEGILNGGKGDSDRSGSSSPARSGSRKGSRTAGLVRKLSTKKASSSQDLSSLGSVRKSKTIAMPEASSTSPLGDKGPEAQTWSTTNLQKSFAFADSSEPGGQAVIFKSATPVRIPNSDVNIAVERRNRAPATMGLTMVTAVAHVWFNAFFEGRGPEQDGKADDSGVFEIAWDKMDGIKGSSQKGTRACDHLSVVWRVVGAKGADAEGQTIEASGVTIVEPGGDSPVPQMAPADWKGENKPDPGGEKKLGLRAEEPDSSSVSKASSVKSQEMGGDAASDKHTADIHDDDESLKGVKTSGPAGEEDILADEVLETQSPKPMAKDKGDGDVADSIAQNGFIIE